jgi:hypothetical protein
MDLVGELAVTIHDYRWVLVVQDYLTKYVLMFPIASKDALTIAALLVHQVFYRFGFPKKIQSGLIKDLSSTIYYSEEFWMQHQ